MRQHLYQCLEKGCLLPFPVKRSRRALKKVVTVDSFDVYSSYLQNARNGCYCHALLNTCNYVSMLLLNTWDEIFQGGGTKYSNSMLSGGTKYFVQGDKIGGNQIFHDRSNSLMFAPVLTVSVDLIPLKFSPLTEDTLLQCFAGRFSQYLRLRGLLCTLLGK